MDRYRIAAKSIHDDQSIRRIRRLTQPQSRITQNDIERHLRAFSHVTEIALIARYLDDGRINLVVRPVFIPHGMSDDRTRSQPNYSNVLWGRRCAESTKHITEWPLTMEIRNGIASSLLRRKLPAMNRTVVKNRVYAVVGIARNSQHTEKVSFDVQRSILNTHNGRADNDRSDTKNKDQWPAPCRVSDDHWECKHHHQTR